MEKDNFTQGVAALVRHLIANRASGVLKNQYSSDCFDVEVDDLVQLLQNRGHEVEDIVTEVLDEVPSTCTCGHADHSHEKQRNDVRWCLVCQRDCNRVAAIRRICSLELSAPFDYPFFRMDYLPGEHADTALLRLFEQEKATGNHDNDDSVVLALCHG